MTVFPDIDVRPILAGGQDPLESVVSAAARIPEGGELTLDAPFNPLPLRRVLGKMGFSSTAEKLAEGHWRVSLLRDGLGQVNNQPGPEDCQGLPPEAPLRREADGLHIDVRGLEMPLPMVAILRLVGSLGDDEQVVVHHERDPLFLYPELAELGWGLTPLDGGEPGELLFLLRRV